MGKSNGHPLDAAAGSTEGGHEMIHALKIYPEYFEAVRIGEKRFELRDNDRDFRVPSTPSYRITVFRSTRNPQEPFIRGFPVRRCPI